MTAAMNGPSASGPAPRFGPGPSASSRAAPSAAGKQPYPHVDDLTSASVELDPHTPMRKVLETGDTHMRQALTFKDFRRPDLALQEYIRAFTIAVDVIPKHKDYPMLRADRGDLNRLYSALKVKITNHGQAFDKVKQLIKEENLRTGVQRTRPRSSSEQALMNLPSVPSNAPGQQQSAVNGHSRTASHARGPSKGTHSRGPSTSSVKEAELNNPASPSRKPKPVIQPKPQALHGNAIKATPAASSQPQDLAARFANLRTTPEPNGANSAAASKPAGPREMPPKNQRVRPTINSSIPTMPKQPDAIYSPARGTLTSEVADLPSSTPRGMFSRTNSVASVPSASARTSMENALRTFTGDQYPATNAFGEPLTPQTAEIQIPTQDTLTPEEFRGLMRLGSGRLQVLLIDVRDRQSFDEGHIMSQRTICVEPEILSRENISADAIAESMVIAPEKEHMAFEQRHKAHLVVVYDDDSTSIPKRASSNSKAAVLFNIIQALTHFNYDKPLKAPPKLLAGGLDAWIDELGEQSLATSRTVAPPSAPPPLRTISQRPRARTKTLNKREIERFQESIQRDQTAASPNDYIRDEEEFMRRYPALPREQESMSSPLSPLTRSQTYPQELADDGHLYTGMDPSPPTRPAPAVPRTRYSGLESRDDAAGPGVVGKKNNSSLFGVGARRTGLLNPGNWCYANATIQSLLASPGFVQEILNADWPARWRAPKTSGENDAPQLLARIMGNLLQWMDKRQFDSMKATTFMAYLNSITKPYAISSIKGTKWIRLGDASQHDSDELLTFLFNQLDSETNRKRHTKVDKAIEDGANFDGPFHEALTKWSGYFDGHCSITDKWWQSILARSLRCKNTACSYTRYQFETSNTLAVTPEAGGDDGLEVALPRLLEKGLSVELKCEKCNHPEAEMERNLLRAPPLLCFKLSRNNPMGGTAKSTVPFGFPIDNLDLSRYGLSGAPLSTLIEKQPKDMGGGFQEQPLYDLYAVVIHKGETANSGHYWSWVREGPGSVWTKCEDSMTSDMNLDSPPPIYVGTHMYKQWQMCQDSAIRAISTPTHLFYKRRDIPWYTRKEP